MNLRARVGLVAVLCVIGAGTILFAGEPDAELAKVRQAVAAHYFDPAARLALARYFRDHAQGQLGFYICEEVRDSFTDEEFSTAFEQVMNDFNPSGETLKKLEAEFAANKSAKLAIRIADIHIYNENYSEARRWAKQAMALESENGDWAEVYSGVLEEEHEKDEAAKVMVQFYAEHPQAALTLRWKMDQQIREKTSAEEIKKLVNDAIVKHPEYGYFYAARGSLNIQATDPSQADADYTKAAELSTDSAQTIGSAARYFLKVHPVPETALKYYLQVYYLHPRYNDGELVDARVKKLTWERGSARFDELRGNKTELLTLFSDADLVTVGKAVEAAKTTWDAAYADPLFALWNSDDPNLRWEATDCLMNHADDAVRDRAVKLLADPDPFKQGMAMYLSMKCKGADGIADIKPFLNSEVEMLRYDAASALLMFGGAAGMKEVAAYLPGEKNAWWKKRLEALMTPPPARGPVQAPTPGPAPVPAPAPAPALPKP